MINPDNTWIKVKGMIHFNVQQPDRCLVAVKLQRKNKVNSRYWTHLWSICRRDNNHYSDAGKNYKRGRLQTACISKKKRMSNEQHEGFLWVPMPCRLNTAHCKQTKKMGFQWHVPVEERQPRSGHAHGKKGKKILVSNKPQTFKVNKQNKWKKTAAHRSNIWERNVYSISNSLTAHNAHKRKEKTHQNTLRRGKMLQVYV